MAGFLKHARSGYLPEPIISYEVPDIRNCCQKCDYLTGCAIAAYNSVSRVCHTYYSLSINGFRKKFISHNGWNLYYKVWTDGYLYVF